MPKTSNIHTNHRKRLKSKFVNSGLDGFAEHEILELMLFYSIPQADTNPLAHKLIDRFGSLKNVLDASIENLCTISGIAEHSAIMLKLFPAVMNVYNKQANKTIKQLSNQIIAMEYCTHLFKGIDHEEFYVICLNAKSEIIGVKKLSTGDASKVEVKLRTITDFVLKNKCDRIIITHNHPNSKSKPSDDDILMTHKLFSSCVLNEIDVLDHIIYSPSGCYSFAETEILKAIKIDVLDILNYDKNSDIYKRFCTSYESYVIK